MAPPTPPKWSETALAASTMDSRKSSWAGLPQLVVEVPALWMSILPSRLAMPMEQFLMAPPKPPIAWPLKCASETTES